MTARDGWPERGGHSSGPTRITDLAPPPEWFMQQPAEQGPTVRLLAEGYGWAKETT